MNTTIKTLASIAILSPMANAALVGLNFQGDNTFNLAATTTAGSTAGTTIVPQQNWNNALNENRTIGSIANLISSTGSSSGITAEWYGPDSWKASGTGLVGASGNEQMSYGFIKATGPSTFTPTGNVTVTFSGFTVGSVFDMVIYTATNNQTLGTFSLNDTLNTSVSYNIGLGNIATFTENSTKHMFTNLTAVGNSVTLTMSTAEAGLAGVQFSPIPEPSSAVLLGLGALGLLSRRTRRQA